MHTIFSLLDFSFDGEIRTADFPGVRVDCDGKTLTIGCSCPTQFTRGLFEFARNWKGEPLHLEEHPHFRCAGVQLDLSRNAVMTVDSIKTYLVHMAALGLNTLFLYMEDVFALEGYPRFGYLRGRYTVEELKEIDAFGERLGIEVIPSIQTLGHMGQYLRWDEADPVRDTPEILLADVPETYDLIEAILKTMRQCFHTDRINIGLDEAADLGRGEHLNRFGWEDGTSIFLRHLDRVCGLCRKYGLKPMMCDDTFMRLGSPTGSPYDPDFRVTEELRRQIPDVQLCYWDYYSVDQKNYDRMLEIRKDFDREIFFLGSIWTYEGFTVDTEFTLQTTFPALRSCLDHGVEEAYLTTWGDCGGETNLMQTLPLLPLLSEFVYFGRDCSLETIAAASEALTKIPFRNLQALSRSHSYLHNYSKVCRRILYTDLFYNLVDLPADFDRVQADFEACRDSADAFRRQKDAHEELYTYYYFLMKTAARKCRLLRTLKPAYDRGDREYLRQVSEEEIPVLLEDYRAFGAAFRKQWLQTNKPNGLEMVNIRLGGVTAQLEYENERLKDYLRGELREIPELQYTPVESKQKTYWEFWDLTTASSIRR